ncbi:hypothetical protein LV779_24450 [Streptomyces thinghirensis]|nr:hypothetical protein [Streptomyces thinghirensis]
MARPPVPPVRRRSRHPADDPPLRTGRAGAVLPGPAARHHAPASARSTSPSRSTRCWTRGRLRLQQPPRHGHYLAPLPRPRTVCSRRSWGGPVPSATVWAAASTSTATATCRPAYRARACPSPWESACT